jgi:hypothetical protein
MVAGFSLPENLALTVAVRLRCRRAATGVDNRTATSMVLAPACVT